ncbi:hypothetical protein GCM10027028_28040 [Streptomyces sundarbansensis]
MAHLAVLHQLVEGGDDLLDRNGLVVEVRVEEVDVVGAEPAQRCLCRALDGAGRQAPERGVGTGLGGDDDVGPVGAGGEPLADDGLGLTAPVALDPGGVRVGGVDDVAAGRDVGVQDGEGLFLVRRPAEDVAAEGEGEDLEAGGAERDAR